MNHAESDRVPIDLGSTSLTGMSPSCQKRLLAALGFQGEPGEDPVDERILNWAGTDFRSVGGIIGLRSSLSRKISDIEYVDCWGVRRKRAGQYWDITHSPLSGASIDDIKGFPWPDTTIEDDRLVALHDKAKHLRDEDRFVVVGEHPVFGILEMGCWMCGYEDFLARILIDPDFVLAFFETFFLIQSSIIEQYYGAIGEYIDLTISGDDFGMQLGSMVSPAMFREFIAPFFSKRIQLTKKLASCYYWHHTCGSVVELLSDIIDCGVDIINPIQTSAVGMDPADLKARFGDRVVFWGAIDVQDFLRTADPDLVKQHTKNVIRTLGRDGGYILAPAHNIQDDVPPENIIAMIQTANTVNF